MGILTRVLTIAITFLALNSARPKSHPVDPNVQIEVTVSLNGETKTVWMLPGKIQVEKHTFKVWRNSLILCGPVHRGARQCRLAGETAERSETP